MRIAFSLLAIVAVTEAYADDGGSALESIKSNLNANSVWELVNAQPLHFPSHHPQGLVKIGNDFYLSSVETTQPPTRIETPQAGFDRTSGEGIGHLFRFSETGELLTDLVLGEGSLYHPGGMDFDGESLWVSVAEYRPNSLSIVYEIDPKSLQAEKAFRFDDHLGGVLRDPQTDTLYGISWGSRKYYRWSGLEGSFNANNVQSVTNPSFYIDYQDCQWLPEHMLCSGLNSYRSSSGELLKLGGLELINLATLKPVLQVPVTLTVENGTPLTQNPFYFETNENNELILYFVPEDDSSTLYTYKVKNANP